MALMFVEEVQDCLRKGRADRRYTGCRAVHLDFKYESFGTGALFEIEFRQLAQANPLQCPFHNRTDLSSVQVKVSAHES